MSKIAAAIVVVVFFAGAVRWFLPSLTLERQTVAATPSLQGLYVRSEILVRKGVRACIAPVPLDHKVREVQMLLNARGKSASPLDITLHGASYSATARFAGYPAGHDALTTARLSSAPTTTGDGELCLVNRGRHAVALVGTSEGSSLTLPVTKLDGKPVVDVDPALTFLTGKRQNILSEASTVMGRIAGFTGVIPMWLLWPLALLFFFGIPIGAAAVILLSDRRA